MNEDDLIPPSTIREWSDQPASREAVDAGQQRLEQPLDVTALLAGIRFLHNFVKSEEGTLAVERAFDEGFVHGVPDASGKKWAIPRLIWRDHIYEDLCPGKSLDVSIGIQVARYMLWGPPDFLSPDFLANRAREKACNWDQAIREALRRFEAERKQRRQQLAEAIRGAAGELAAQAEPGCANDDGMVAMSSVEIFELVRLRIPDVTQGELNETIMQILPYMGPRH
jgi:hypothetical protein